MKKDQKIDKLIKTGAFVTLKKKFHFRYLIVDAKSNLPLKLLFKGKKVKVYALKPRND